jgi:hypothetical protein
MIKKNDAICIVFLLAGITQSLSFRGKRNLHEQLRTEYRQSLWSYLRRFLFPRNDNIAIS